MLLLAVIANSMHLLMGADVLLVDTIFLPATQTPSSTPPFPPARPPSSAMWLAYLLALRGQGEADCFFARRHEGLRVANCDMTGDNDAGEL
jgi:hypothetical protein